MRREGEVFTVSSEDGHQMSVFLKGYYETFNKFYEMVEQKVFFEQCPELAGNTDVFEWYISRWVRIM